MIGAKKLILATQNIIIEPSGFFVKFIDRDWLNIKKYRFIDVKN